MNFLGFGQSAEIELVLDDADKRKTAEIRVDENRKDKLLLYYDGEGVSGKIDIKLKKPGQKLEHHGIKVEFVGQIELYYDRGNHLEFTSLVKELAGGNEICLFLLKLFSSLFSMLF